MTASEDIEIRVRERAYEIWEEEGRPEGRERDHWERAWRELNGGDGEVPAEVPGEEVPATGKIDHHEVGNPEDSVSRLVH